MIFNSGIFLVFFSAFFLLYWLAGKQQVKYQNGLLLMASYVFYGWTDYRLLAFLILSTLLNFYLGLIIARRKEYRKYALNAGLLFGIGSLAYFKYFNFFLGSFQDLFSLFHVQLNVHTMHIIIPLGISFYTFKTISYLLDVDKGKMEACKDLQVFSAYVAFFPTVLSGPIDRARDFIPQLKKPRSFDYNQAINGARQILWGLFKKLVIADNCASIVDPIYANYQHLPGSTLAIGAFFYSIQMYADFSGYSDMAIGIGRLIGFQVTRNFDNPFFAQNIAEYWRKWHISLTSWLTEYVFTPLNIAFRDLGKVGLILSILLNFIIVGLWHGASWNFVLFGFLHGCYFIPLILTGNMNKKRKIRANKLLPSASELFNMISVFMLATLTFIVFRAPDIHVALGYIKELFSGSIFNSPYLPMGSHLILIVLFFSGLMFLMEWLHRDKEYGLQIDSVRWPLLRLGIYYALIFTIIIYDAGGSDQFIYFQF